MVETREPALSYETMLETVVATEAARLSTRERREVTLAEILE